MPLLRRGSLALLAAAPDLGHGVTPLGRALGGVGATRAPKKGNAKECSNYRIIAPISHASKVMLKILQARMALKHVYYHVRNESPVYVRYRIHDAWAWCTGKIQRDDMGWQVGGGFRIGNSCTPVADSCQCMAKPIQYCKAK